MAARPKCIRLQTDRRTITHTKLDSQTANRQTDKQKSKVFPRNDFLLLDNEK